MKDCYEDNFQNRVKSALQQGFDTQNMDYESIDLKVFLNTGTNWTEILFKGDAKYDLIVNEPNLDYGYKILFKLDKENLNQIKKDANSEIPNLSIAIKPESFEAVSLECLKILVAGDQAKRKELEQDIKAQYTGLSDNNENITNKSQLDIQNIKDGKTGYSKLSEYCGGSSKKQPKQNENTRDEGLPNIRTL